jgi:hypothetical protein
VERISNMKKILAGKMVKKLQDEIRDYAENSYIIIVPVDSYCIIFFEMQVYGNPLGKR